MMQFHRCVSILPLAMASIAVATDIHVPGDYPTIQAASAATAAGDTILVAEGTYHENVTVGVDLRMGKVRDIGRLPP